MKSRITKFAAMAVIVIAVLIGMNLLGIPADGATVAFAKTIEAMKQMPWMRAVAELEGPQGKEEMVHWVCFEKSIEIAKRIDGTIRFRDEGQDTMYVYEPANKSLIITSLSDRYAVNRRVSLPQSPMEAIEKLLERLEEEGQTEISITNDIIDGQTVEIIKAISTIDNDTISKQEIMITIDIESRLPISMETIATKPDGEVWATAKVAFDYPNEGPKDIYSLGVPEETQIIDRRPRAVADSEIAIDYHIATNPENPEQEMLILYDGINIDLVKIPEGEFLMGSPEDEIGYPARVLEHYGKSKKSRVRKLKHPFSEDPQHLVKIAQAFYMSKFEITCAQFRRFQPEFRKMPRGVGGLGKKLMVFPMDLDDQPAGVSLNDAMEFCTWLSKKTGLQVRLPCEAEWEYACRAGTQTRFYWGDSEEEAGKYANIADKSFCKAQPDTASYGCNTDDGNVCLAPVGQYLPNNFGLYDMIGNASEWVDGVYCPDAYSIYPEGKSFDQNEQDEQEIYLRGGSWSTDLMYWRCASRWWLPKDAIPSSSTRSYIGFRIIIDGQ